MARQFVIFVDELPFVHILGPHRCHRCGPSARYEQPAEAAHVQIGRGRAAGYTRLATTHHSFLGSFSAVSKRNFATKYAFFQVFRDLQNYLAAFLKKLQNFAKNRKILQNFCEISGFLQNKSAVFAKFADSFLQNLQFF